MSPEDIQIPTCPDDGYHLVWSPTRGQHRVQVADGHIYAIGDAAGVRFVDLDIGIPWATYAVTELGIRIEDKSE